MSKRIRTLRFSGPLEFLLAVEVTLRRAADYRLAAGRDKGVRNSTLTRAERADAAYKIAQPWLERAYKAERVGRRSLALAARRLVDRDLVAHKSESVKDFARRRASIKALITEDRARAYLERRDASGRKRSTT